MSKKAQRPSRTGKPVSRSPAKAATGAKKSSRTKKAVVWFGSFGTIVLGGALANLSSNSAQQLTSSPSTANATPYQIAAQPISTSRHRASDRPTPSRNPGPPLTVISEDPIDPGDIGGVWAFSGKIKLSKAQLGYLNGMKSINDQDNWFFSHGGAEPSTDTQLVVGNNRNYVIRVINMNVIKTCSAPLSGTLFYAPDAGGDADIRLGFDLDSADTEAEGATGWYVPNWRPDYFANYTVSIQPRDQQVFNLRTVVTKYSCTFEYRLTILDGTKKIYQNIGDDGQPFHVSALPSGNSRSIRFSSYRVMYAGGVANPKSSGYVRVDPRAYGG